MPISTQDLREAAADVAVRVAKMAAESDEGFNAQVLRSTFMALLEARVPTAIAAPAAPASPPTDPNAEGEALAAAIVASARLADSQAGGTSEVEALAAEIVAAAGLASGKGRS